MKKIINYTIPDELFSTYTTLGKTSSQLYDGPDYLVLWIDIESNKIEETFSPESEPDRPIPLNCKREVLDTDSDENIIKIALLFGGLEKPKIYEVAVGPEDQRNAIITDTTDLRMVYDEDSIVKDYTAPLKFRENKRIYSDDFIRSLRNSALAESDGRIPPDMPEELKVKWLKYRQQLRDLPKDWLDVPNWLIKMPFSPDESFDPNFEDPEVTVIRLHERSISDAEVIRQLPKGVN